MCKLLCFETVAVIAINIFVHHRVHPEDRLLCGEEADIL